MKTYKTTAYVVVEESDLTLEELKTNLTEMVSLDIDKYCDEDYDVIASVSIDWEHLEEV